MRALEAGQVVAQRGELRGGRLVVAAGGCELVPQLGGGRGGVVALGLELERAVLELGRQPLGARRPGGERLRLGVGVAQALGVLLGASLELGRHPPGAGLERGGALGLSAQLAPRLRQRGLGPGALVRERLLLRGGGLAGDALALVRGPLELGDARDEPARLRVGVPHPRGLRQRLGVLGAQGVELGARLLGAGARGAVVLARRGELALEIGQARRRRFPDLLELGHADLQRGHLTLVGFAALDLLLRGLERELEIRGAAERPLGALGGRTAGRERLVALALQPPCRLELARRLRHAIARLAARRVGLRGERPCLRKLPFAVAGELLGVRARVLERLRLRARALELGAELGELRLGVGKCPGVGRGALERRIAVIQRALRLGPRAIGLLACLLARRSDGRLGAARQHLGVLNRRLIGGGGAHGGPVGLGAGGLRLRLRLRRGLRGRGAGGLGLGVRARGGLRGQRLGLGAGGLCLRLGEGDGLRGLGARRLRLGRGLLGLRARGRAVGLRACDLLAGRLCLGLCLGGEPLGLGTRGVRLGLCLGGELLGLGTRGVASACALAASCSASARAAFASACALAASCSASARAVSASARAAPTSRSRAARAVSSCWRAERSAAMRSSRRARALAISSRARRATSSASVRARSSSVMRSVSARACSAPPRIAASLCARSLASSSRLSRAASSAVPRARRSASRRVSRCAIAWRRSSAAPSAWSRAGRAVGAARSGALAAGGLGGRTAAADGSGRSTIPRLDSSA